MSSIIGAEGSKDFYWRESGVWMRDCLLNTYYFWLNKWFILMVYSVRSSLHQNKNRKGQRDGIKKYVCSVKLYNKKKRVSCLNCKKDFRVCQLCVFSHWSKRRRLKNPVSQMSADFSSSHSWSSLCYLCVNFGLKFSASLSYPKRPYSHK